MKKQKVTKKIVLRIDGVDASQACELFYSFHNAFVGLSDYEDSNIIVWEDDESSDLTKAKEIGLTVYLNESENPEIVKTRLGNVLERIRNVICK